MSRNFILAGLFLVLVVLGADAQQSPTPSATTRPAYVPGGRIPVFMIPVGTPTASTPGKDGEMRMDAKYIYTFLAGSWSKSPRYNLTPQ